MDIKAEVIPVEKLINYYFFVPDYQREYVWQVKNHVRKLFEDIESEFSETNNLKNQSSYFIVPIIIVKRLDGDYDVIDGQQRLTTLVLFLIAIK